MQRQSTVMVVGASRGLGLALVQEWCSRGERVIATVRRQSDALQTLARRFPASLAVETVDITKADSVKALRSRLEGQRIDILFVNAGIARAIEATPAGVEEQDFLDMMLTNALAPVRAVELVDDLVPADGVIAVMSSELGSITNSAGSWQLYASSKAALNMLMKCLAARRPDDLRALLVVAPGWVRTDMGGSDAELSIEESIPLVVRMVEANRGKPGLRYLDRFSKRLPW
jgi:NAD(P)-dependent dehydrogenase (short-subunit alcohol dehydrogenase family)